METLLQAYDYPTHTSVSYNKHQLYNSVALDTDVRTQQVTIITWHQTHSKSQSETDWLHL